MSGGPVGESLSAAQQQARQGPTKPAAVVLEGRYVRVAPLEEAHIAPLFAMSNGTAVKLSEERQCPAYDAEETVWKYMFDSPQGREEDFRAMVAQQQSFANGRPFTVIDKGTQKPIGMAVMMNNFPAHLKCELGCIWYSPIAQRTWANTETTFLLAQHIFETLGYERLEWKCDALNARSRAAAEKMGFKFEGVQDAHFIYKDRYRDTAWFRILAAEWPAVKAKLIERMKK